MNFRVLFFKKTSCYFKKQHFYSSSSNRYANDFRNHEIISPLKLACRRKTNRSFTQELGLLNILRQMLRIILLPLPRLYLYIAFQDQIHLHNFWTKKGTNFRNFGCNSWNLVPQNRIFPKKSGKSSGNLKDFDQKVGIFREN